MATRKSVECGHAWSMWGIPYIVPEIKAACQIRHCTMCGAAQERTVGTYRAVKAFVDLLNRVVH